MVLNAEVTLSQVLNLVGSDKAKDRAEGLRELKHIVSDKKKCEVLGIEAGGLGWLRLFQTMFGAVNVERSKAIKAFNASKSAPPNLYENADTVRWLVDAAIPWITNKVTSALISHLTQTIIHKHSLFPGISIVYIRTLKAILSYQPHLEHLDDLQWRNLMSLCWDGLFGRPLRFDRDDWDDPAVARGSERSERVDDMEVDELEPSSSTMTHTQRKKRSSDKDIGSSTIGSLSQEAIEFASIIPILLASSEAPILPRPKPIAVGKAVIHRAGLPLLREFLTFFGRFPKETSAHRHIVSALNVLFGELELNYVAEMRTMGIKILPFLVGLWGTKNQELKEQVLIAMRTILPFLAHNPSINQDFNPSVRTARIDYESFFYSQDTPEILKRLVNVVEDGMKGGGAKGMEPLDLGGLDLDFELDVEEVNVQKQLSWKGKEKAPEDLDEKPSMRVKQRRKPFHARILRAGALFSASDAMTWATLELLADCLGLLHTHAETLANPQTHASPSKPAKRQRMENLLESTVRKAKNERLLTTRILHLQTLLFAVEHHWGNFHDQLQRDLQDAFIYLLVDSSAEVQSWSLVCLGTILAASRGLTVSAPTLAGLTQPSPGRYRAAAQKDKEDWDKVFQSAMRKTSAAGTSRAACLVASLVLGLGRISNTQSLPALEEFLRNIPIQGPAYPHDTVCQLISLALTRTSQDLRLHKLTLEENVCNWFAQSIAKFEDIGKGRWDALSPIPVANMLSQVVGFHPPLQEPGPSYLPACATSQRMQDEVETYSLRQVLLHGRVLGARPSVGLKTSSSLAVDSEASPTLPNSQGRRDRICASLQSVVEIHTRELEQNRENQWTAVRIRTSIDVAVLALLFEGAMLSNFAGNECRGNCLTGASLLLSQCLRLLLESDWEPKERAYLLAGVDLLSGDYQLGSAGQLHDAAGNTLLPMGPKSGMLRTTGRNTVDISQIDDNLAPRPSGSHNEVLIQIWQSGTVFDTFKTSLDPFKAFLRKVGGPETTISTPQFENGLDDDEFGPIRTDDSNLQVTVGRLPANAYVGALMQMIIRAIINPRFMNSGGRRPIRDSALVHIVNESSESFPLLSGPVFQAAQDRRLELRAGELSSIHEAVDELMQMFDYRKSVPQRIAIASFVETIITLGAESLAVDEDVRSAGMALFQFLMNLVNVGKINSYRLRIRLTALVDRFLASDGAESLWPELRQNAPSGNAPSQIIRNSISDADARVRFVVASSVPHQFESIPQHVLNPVQLFNDIHQILETRSSSDFENNITDLILFGNIIIVSSGGRRAPLYQIYTMAHMDSAYQPYIQAILDCTTAQMSLAGLSELYLEYAPRLVVSHLGSSHEFWRLPVSLYGFSSRKLFARAILSRAGSLILQSGQQSAWKILADTAGAQIESLCEEHAPAAYALLLTQVVKHLPPGLSDENANDIIQANMTAVRNNIKAMGSQMGDVAESYDSIVGHLFEIIDDTDSLDACIELMRLGTEDELEQAHVLRQFAPADYSAAWLLEDTNSPKASFDHVRSSLKWLFKMSIDKVDSVRIAFNALMRISAQIGQSNLLNERQRCTQNISILVAWYHPQFAGPVLPALLRTLRDIYSEPDLCSRARPMLQWALGKVLVSRSGDFGLAELLVHIACSAKNLSSLDSTEAQHEEGRQTLDWLETYLESLLKSRVHRQDARNAVVLWPRSLPRAILEQVESLGVQGIMELVENGKINVGKFALSRKLLEAWSDSTEDQSAVIQEALWQLRSSIPDRSDANLQDVHAFVELLFLAKGKISAPRLSVLQRLGDASRMITPRPSNRKSELKKVEQGIDSKPVILLKLFQQLSQSSLAKRFASYRALSVLSSPAASGKVIPLLPSQLRLELSYMATLAIALDVRAESLSGLLEDAPWKTRHHSFDSWVCSLASLLAQVISHKDVFYSGVISTFEADVDLSRCLLPAVIHGVLNHPEIGPRSRKTLSRYFTFVLCSDQVHIGCLRSIIDTVVYLREFQPHTTTLRLQSDYWLDLDYLALSRAAVRCKSFATALLFLEIGRDSECPVDMVQSSQADCSDLLYNIYSNVEDPDGFYGISPGQDVRKSLLRRLHHENQWSQAFQYHGADFEADLNSAQHNNSIVKSLQSFGFNRLAMLVETNLSDPAAQDLNQSQVSLGVAWRTQMWDVPAAAASSNDPEAAVYWSLRALHRSPDPAIGRFIAVKNTQIVLDQLRGLGSEDMTGMRTTWRELLSLREINLWHDRFAGLALPSKFTDNAWATFTALPSGVTFGHVQNIMAVRKALLQAARAKEGHQLQNFETATVDSIKLLQFKCNQFLCSISRENSDLQSAVNAITECQRLDPSPGNVAVTMDFAQVLWMQGEHGLAIDQLKQVLLQIERPVQGTSRKGGLLAQSESLGKTLALLGKYVSHARQAKPEDINNQYFKKSVEKIESGSASAVDRASVYHAYACFADTLQEDMRKDTDLVPIRARLERKEVEIEKLKKDKRTQRMATAQALTFEQQLNALQHERAEESSQVESHTKNCASFLKLSLKMYGRALAVADVHNDSILRLCALWLQYSGDEGLNTSFKSTLDAIPSHKFGLLVNQLTARLQSTNTGNDKAFQANLYRLLLRLCSEHPFHIMYQLLTLAHSVRNLDSKSRRSGGGGSYSARETAASDILSTVKAQPIRAQIILQASMFCHAAVNWANVDTPKPKDGEARDPRKSMAAGEPLAKFQDLSLPVVTEDVPYDLSKVYNHLVTIRRYEPNYTIAGGQSRPKIMICVGSDGRMYRQLFKGHDDVRQDAVMQQVFALINKQLDANEQSRQRKLRFRTYNVRYLAAGTGIIQFIGDAISVGTWLNPAHMKYHPNEPKPADCRARLATTQDNNVIKKDAEQTFLAIRKDFTPVFRHFFTEYHTEPMAWFMMRLNYSRSVAVTSMVGHVIGLGDRHATNVMIDRVTGEIVHIDFGIVFERGKVLVIPELVPFRLTRDFVDGFGTMGVDGTFRRCCELTLTILRDASEVVLTVLECLKYDPLQKWAEEQGSYDIQTTAEDPLGLSTIRGSGHADRALTKVASKLAKGLSVEYTVNELIRQATDTSNLAKIFVGWAPWL